MRGTLISELDFETNQVKKYITETRQWSTLNSYQAHGVKTYGLPKNLERATGIEPVLPGQRVSCKRLLGAATMEAFTPILIAAFRELSPQS